MKYTSNFKFKNQVCKSNSLAKAKLLLNKNINNNIVYSRNLILSNISLINSIAEGEKSCIGPVSFKDLKLFSKKSKITRYTILRAPYRYKKGRYQVGFSRYDLNISYTILIDKYFINVNSLGSKYGLSNLDSLINLNKFILPVVKSNNTNIATLNKARLTYSISSCDFFKLNNYN